MSIKLGQNEVQEYLNINVTQVEADLSNYYTKEEVDGKIPSLAGYATEAFVSGKVADLIDAAPDDLNTIKELAEAIADNEGLIAGLNAAITSKADKTTLNSYALKTEIPSLNGYATVAWVEERIGDIDVGDINLGDYALKSELFSKDYNDLTNTPDLSKLDEITQNETEIIFSSEPSPNGVDLRSITVGNVAYNITIDDTANYATETYVNTKVANLVDSAPEALNTLGELATALQTHEDEYDALLTTVGNKANKSELFSKNYNDLTNKPTIPNIVYSSTQPSSPTTGMIWLKPI